MQEHGLGSALATCKCSGSGGEVGWWEEEEEQEEEQEQGCMGHALLQQ
jgi:hypothetical protein